MVEIPSNGIKLMIPDPISTNFVIVLREFYSRIVNRPYMPDNSNPSWAEFPLQY